MHVQIVYLAPFLESGMTKRAHVMVREDELVSIDYEERFEVQVFCNVDIPGVAGIGPHWVALQSYGVRKDAFTHARMFREHLQRHGISLETTPVKVVKTVKVREQLVD